MGGGELASVCFYTILFVISLDAIILDDHSLVFLSVYYEYLKHQRIYHCDVMFCVTCVSNSHEDSDRMQLQP